MMEYKGYQGKVELDEDAGVFHGTVVNTRDVIAFQGTSFEELRQAFHDSVDDYLEFCADRGEEPDKPCSGKFLLRMAPADHRAMMMASNKSALSLNAWACQRLVASAVQELGGPRDPRPAPP